jgi:hypothetical protein
VAIQVVQEWTITDRSTKNYDAMKETIGTNHPGLIFHTAGFDDESGVFRIVDTWESREAAQSFYEGTLGPLVQQMLANDPNATPPERELMYELHDVIS